MSRGSSVVTLLIALLVAPPGTRGGSPSPEEIRSAVERSLPLIARSAKEYTGHRDCFSCHHQAVPVVALSLAKERGFSVDASLLRAQMDHTEADLGTAAESYRKGEGQPGGVTRAGYALWTLEAGGWESDETTEAVVEFLLKRDEGRGHWYTSSNRPPSEASPFTSTFLAIRGLGSFGRLRQKERIAARLEAARDWLLKTPAKDTEDRVFRLWGLKAAGGTDDAVKAAAQALRETQRGDGGWSQLDNQSSDAYATGSALVALHLAGRLATDDPAYRRGLAYLKATQQPDGSWHVKSRSKPFQTYFESGFPYKGDQFISMAASSWATAALVLACPKPGS
jgi:squalene cyclase